MASLATLLVLFHMLELSGSIQDIRYVTSNDSHRPDGLTLEQYIAQKNRYFTTGAIFVFLEGNHSLLTPLELTDISNLSLIGNGSSASILSSGYISLFNATYLSIAGLTFMRSNENKSILTFNHSNIQISNSIFQSSEPSASAALSSYSSNITIMNCLFEDNRNIKDVGGAIFAVLHTHLTLIGTNFTRNGAFHGGAIYASESSLVLKGTTMNNFSNNYCNDFPDKDEDTSFQTPCTRQFTGYNGYYYHCQSEAYGKRAKHFINCQIFKQWLCSAHGFGGAIYCIKCTVNLTGNNYFGLNDCSSGGGYGGAISIYAGQLAISGIAHFIRNRAGSGAIYLECFYALIEGDSIKFEDNTGGGIHMEYSYDVYAVTDVCIDEKKINKLSSFQKTLISANFTDNDGIAIQIMKSAVDFSGVNVFLRNQLSLYISYHSTVTFNGHTSILSSNDSGVFITEDSSLSFKGRTLFHNNYGYYGGAIDSSNGKISFAGTTIFTNNTATEKSDGGALYAVRTEISMEGNVSFSFNSAKNGGAMSFKDSYLMFKLSTTLETSYNHASDYGGAIYYDDKFTTNQCGIRGTIDEERPDEIQYCFLQLQPNELQHWFLSYDNTDLGDLTIIHSSKDSAGKDGSFLYGGLLDRCRIKIELENHVNDIIPVHKTKMFLLQEMILIVRADSKNSNNLTNGVASKPYQLCLCTENHKFNECINTQEISIHRGKNFTLNVQAIGQNNSIVPTEVTAETSSNARLRDNQQSKQNLPHNCSNLTYSIYSKENQTDLTLYRDGPCGNTGTARMTINVILLPCPDAFTQEGGVCVCEERLQAYNANCMIGEKITIARKTGSKFWMSTLYRNHSYEGLILYHSCPTSYCINENINITLDNLDIQCGHNRIGVLCGGCAINYSLLLGGSRCDVCSHHYLALLIPFAVAGIALVVFLSCLRLTVATGFINSFILYANFVQANKIILFPSNEINVLTVFIAWLNLDLGFETCFIPGLNAYTQTWLQFAFPLYVWILIGLIVISSRYSITISKLIGTNPIAVLATLILMSYTKILKIIIEIFSFAELDYPGRYKNVYVWLKDANVPYLKSKHLALSVITSLVLILLFLPYTILLLTGPCLYRASCRKCIFFLKRIKPLLDSYYAPYKKNTRYWTGFLLLVRCVLYIVFSFNSLGGTSKSLPAIIITFTLIELIFWYPKGIYENCYINVIESSVCLNLIILSASAASLTDDKARGPIYTLIGIVFITMIGTILYQFHHLYIINTEKWMQIKTKVVDYLKNGRTTTTDSESEMLATGTSTDSVKTVTETVIELREPLLEDSVKS